MTPEEFYTTVLDPALGHIAEFAPKMTRNRALRVLMTAISGQEANWTDRVQIPSGMAHSLFQIQLNAIEDIIANPASAKLFEDGMVFFDVKDTSAQSLFETLAHPAGDFLAVFLARLLLWCNPKPIPYVDEEQALFKYYRETWRPAHADYKRWPHVYGEALTVVPNA